MVSGRHRILQNFPQFPVPKLCISFLAGGTGNNFKDMRSSSQRGGQDGIVCPAPITASILICFLAFWLTF